MENEKTLLGKQVEVAYSQFQEKVRKGYEEMSGVVKSE